MSNSGKENSLESFTLDGNKSKIAERIKMVVDKVGGATAFSELSGLSVSSLGNYTSGRSEPKASILFLVSKIGDVSIDWIVTGENPPRPNDSDIDADVFHAIIDTAFRYGYFKLPMGESPTSLAQDLMEEYERVLFKKNRK